MFLRLISSRIFKLVTLALISNVQLLSCLYELRILRSTTSSLCLSFGMYWSTVLLFSHLVLICTLPLQITTSIKVLFLWILIHGGCALAIPDDLGLYYGCWKWDAGGILFLVYCLLVANSVL